MNEVNSFDLFDTLIGRACYSADELMMRVGEKVGEKNFYALRKGSERHFQKRRLPYTLQDIYNQMGHPEWAEIEWEMEKENVFAIKRYAIHLKHEDIIVSDMYLTEEQLRELLKIAGIDFKGRIYVSPYGKLTGQVWQQIREDGFQIKLHLGDNQITDVESPRRLGVVSTHVKDTALDSTERLYLNVSPKLAWWVRKHRLLNIVNEGKERLNLYQIQYNAPMLWSICYSIKNYVQQNNIKKLLFMARDGQLVHHMWQALYPGEVETEYLYINRDCLRNGSETYFAYLNERLTEDASLVDLCASCGSLKESLPRLDISSPKIFTAVFLAEPFRVELEPIQCTFITTNTRTRINNTYLEMLNYADHWHIADVIDGKSVYDLENEYDMDLVLEYHIVFNSMLLDVPPIENSSAANVFYYAVSQIQEKASLIGNYFPNHIPIEKKHKLNLSFKRAETDNMIVVGAITDYRWTQIDIWYKSLIASGFTGEIHMMCYRVDPATIRKMDRFGIIHHHFQLEHPQIVVDRFRDLPKVLEGMPEYKWVLFPDVGDIAFQYNPVHFLAGVHGHEFVVTHEGVRFKNNAWTDKNLRESYPDHYKKMREKFFINAGSMAGRAGSLSRLSESIYRLSMEAPASARSHDQAAANILLQTSPFLEQTLMLTPDDPWCFCGASSIFAEQNDSRGYEFTLPRITRGECFVGMSQEKTCMFHHYSRNRRIAQDVTQAVHRRYVRR